MSLREGEAAPRTVFDKIWDQHVIRALSDGRVLLRVDRHTLHDGSSRQAFDSLRRIGRGVRDLSLNLAAVDHIVSTLPGRTGESHPPGRERIHALRDNCREFGVTLYDVDDARQGIVHVVAPELGFALPGTVLVCGDSHTATNGALGALAWGIGTTEVFHVLAAQALLLRKPAQMRVRFDGALPRGSTAKDMILYLIARHGVTGGVGFAIEYAGSAVQALPMEARMTLCNMSIEFGARMGLIAVDDVTLGYVHGRPLSPQGALWQQAEAAWRELHSDDGAHFDRELAIDCAAIAPQVTWGNTPQDTVAVDAAVPDPAAIGDPQARAMAERALDYMDLRPGQKIEGVSIDYAFIGSCTNSRLSDLRSAAEVLRGRRVAPGVTALAVPGSTQVKLAAEQEGLDRVFIAAGFEWRNSGCSMCVTSNGDVVARGKRAISSTNRNFEHRQGSGSRTHLASPAMVAAAAVSGCISDVRKFA